MFNDLFYKKILILKKQFISYISGKYNENYFKTMRLQFGIYRQKNSYMIRCSIKNSNIIYKCFYLLSYILKKYDNNYIHLSTRMNFQLNWIKLENFIEILFYFNYIGIYSIHTSGNCIRNLTFNYINFNNNFVWLNLIKSWFYLNSEFLFLPRKFKIVFINNFTNFNSFKFNDLSLYLKKNNNNINFNIFLGGGLGRDPIISKLIFKNINWQNILFFCYNIIKIYNILSLRSNIYKSKIKILFKNLKEKKFLNFLNNSIIDYNLILNEKELNLFNLNYNYRFIYNFYFYKYKIKYNLYFINWLFINNLNNFNFIIFNFFKPSGDINIFQIKIISNLKFKFLINEKHFIIFNSNIKNIYFFYKNLLIINFFNYNLNNYITCPGLDYCNIANSNSIYISIKLKYNLFLYNNLIKISYFSLNISGCINLCSHSNLSNIGFSGLKKNFKEYFNVFIGSKYNYINLSKNMNILLKKNKILYFIFFFIKRFIKNKINNEFLINTYTRLEYIYLKI